MRRCVRITETAGGAFAEVTIAGYGDTPDCALRSLAEALERRAQAIRDSIIGAGAHQRSDPAR